MSPAPFRLIGQSCGINRVRVCPQQPHLVAFWGDNGQVRVLNVQQQLQELAGEQEATGGARAKQQVRRNQSVGTRKQSILTGKRNTEAMIRALEVLRGAENIINGGSGIGTR
jgi:hypothetical protein